MGDGTRALVRVLLGQGLTSVTSFASVLALGRWGGEAALGQYALGWSCWFLVLSLGDTLVSTPYTYFHAQSRRIADDVGGSAAWCVVVLCAGVWAALTIAWWIDVPGLGLLWPALPTAVCAAAVREFYRRHLLAIGRPSELLRVDAVSAALHLAGIGVLVLAEALTANAVYWVMAGAALAVTLPRLSPERLQRLARGRRSAAVVARAFAGYGVWLLMGGLCHVASVQAYPWLAFSSGGERLAGVFAACSALLNVVTPLLTGLTNFYRPRFMHARIAMSDAAFARYTLMAGVVFAVPVVSLALMLFAFGGTLLGALYGQAYVEGAAALGWLALGTVAVAIGAPLQLALLAQRAPATNLAYHGSALLLLAVAALATKGAPWLTVLGQIHCAVNAGATVVLATLFLRYRRSAPPAR